MRIMIGNYDDSLNGRDDSPDPWLLKQYLDYSNLMNHFNYSNQKQYYFFNYQNVHLIAISIEVGIDDIEYDQYDDQYAFVNSGLVSAVSNPNIDWIAVYYHKLAYSSPGYKDSGSSVNPTSEPLRDKYHPLFEDYGVDLVLQAHNHW